MGKLQIGRSSELEKVRSEKIRHGEDQERRGSEERSCMARKGKKVAKHCVFPAPGGGKGGEVGAGCRASWPDER